jgi:hypothetical protein
MFKGREILKSQQKKRYFQINGIARMPWLPAPHQEGLLFSGKMLLGWGVVVSDASELLFEHIKKLNAQQRTDVAACLIYAPISNLPVTTKHSLPHLLPFMILFPDKLTLLINLFVFDPL